MRDLKFYDLVGGRGGCFADLHVVQSDEQGDGEGDSKWDIPFILLISSTKVNFSYKTHTIVCQPSAVSNTVKLIVIYHA